MKEVVCLLFALIQQNILLIIDLLLTAIVFLLLLNRPAIRQLVGICSVCVCVCVCVCVYCLKLTPFLYFLNASVSIYFDQFFYIFK